jgi:ribonucleoside-diphosphate reductase alpha chain
MMRLICHTAYRASIALAREKGAFPFLDREPFLAAPFVASLPADIRDGIAAHGIRNSHLLAIAPTGTISLLADNVSSGLEPIFADAYARSVLDESGIARTYRMIDCAVRQWRQEFGHARDLPPGFVCAADLAPDQQLGVQAALQPFVDNSISKTINAPADCSFATFSNVYDAAYDLGLKGCTTFRPNPFTGVVVAASDDGVDAPHCCAIERKAD